MRQKKIVRLLDYVFILRPSLWFPVWVMGLAGYKHGLAGPSRHSVFYILSLLSLLSGAIYILNQVADVKTDNLNRKLFLIGENHVPRNLALGEAVALIGIAVILAILSSLLIGGLFCLILLAGLLYNQHWKDRVWGGLFLNVVSYGFLVFSIGWVTAGGVQLGILYRSLPYWLAIGSVYLVTTLQDLPGDRQTGKVTFAVKYGKELTINIAAFMLLCTIAAGVVSKDWFLTVSGLCSLPFFAWALITREIEDLVRGAKVALLVLSLLWCLPFPYFLVFIILNYFGSQWYYKMRFHIHYPYLFERTI